MHGPSAPFLVAAFLDTSVDTDPGGLVSKCWILCSLKCDPYPVLCGDRRARCRDICFSMHFLVPKIQGYARGCRGQSSECLTTEMSRRCIICRTLFRYFVMSCRTWEMHGNHVRKEMYCLRGVTSGAFLPDHGIALCRTYTAGTEKTTMRRGAGEGLNCGLGRCFASFWEFVVTIPVYTYCTSYLGLVCGSSI